MKYLEKIFFRMQDREQKLLVVAIAIVLVVACLKLLQNGIERFQSWKEINQLIESHEMILRLKPSIDRALEEQKIAQQNKSYDKKNLSNRVSSLADQVFPARDYRELDTEERERYSQHRVRITFKRSSYDQVNEFAGLIRGESPYMFLSEVKITPNYPPKSRPYDPTTFDAVFEVSSVEFINQ
mgnify:FL=1|tara:strand:+ start:6386 stop:6934 length:549 start_codon:yes stop_codon:yes gene_type:complete